VDNVPAKILSTVRAEKVKCLWITFGAAKKADFRGKTVLFPQTRRRVAPKGYPQAHAQGVPAVGKSKILYKRNKINEKR
jgi:hypothetical protein